LKPYIDAGIISQMWKSIFLFCLALTIGLPTGAYLGARRPAPVAHHEGPEFPLNQLDALRTDWLNRAQFDCDYEVFVFEEFFHPVSRYASPSNPETLLPWWIAERAEAGDPDAQTIAAYYSFGTQDGLKNDEFFAALLAAAESGSRYAQAEIGGLYRSGELGNPIDRNLAVIWLRRAVRQGEPMAAWNLGEMYQRGEIQPSQGDSRSRQQAAADAYLFSASECYEGAFQPLLAYLQDEMTIPTDIEAVAQIRLATAPREPNLPDEFCDNFGCVPWGGRPEEERLAPQQRPDVDPGHQDENE
jgi:hypothetical protein